MDTEQLSASFEEQHTLAKYVGWGGLPQAFDSKNPAWEKEYHELKAILTNQEYAEARGSTLNAHYTPPDVIDGVYSALRQFGIKEGANFLEPASGTGNFAGRNTLNPAEMYMVELDPISASISEHLYPQFKTLNSGFENFIAAPEFFDVAIGNPPFGQYRLHDSKNPQLSRFSVHNYFVGKSIDAVKPGGIAAMVVSRHFLDAKKEKARSYIAEQAHFLGAIRLPNSTFKDNALTSVTTDIVFFQKKLGDEVTDKNWVGTVDAVAPGADDTFTLNSYFAENPEQIIGEMRFRSSAYGPAIDCFATEDTNLKVAIEQRLAILPSDIVTNRPNLEKAVTRRYPKVDFSDTFVKIDSFFKTPDGELAVRTADVMGENTYRFHISKNKTEEARIFSAIDIRDNLYTLINLEVNDGDSDEIEQVRGTLNQLYDKHVKKYGYLSSQVNKSVLRDDPSYSLITSLEVGYDKGVSKAVAEKEGKTPREPGAQKAAILRQRVNQPRKRIDKVSSAKDALVVCLNEFGRVDLDYITQLVGRNADDVKAGLKGLIYQNPETSEWETASKYLAGNVKKKLAIATDAGDEFLENVSALIQVVPADIDAIDIGVELNSTWLPPQVVKDFITTELRLGTGNCYVDYQPLLGRWMVELSGGLSSVRKEKWGTDKIDGNEILTRLMSNAEVKVNRRVGEKDGQPIYQVDIEATLEAQGKAEEINNAFHDWIWRSPERRDSLTRIYNDTMNTHVPVQYDGSHLTLPLASPEIKLRQHQKDAVWRAIQEGTGLFDHTVGAGKTFATVATIMEGRRMGTFKKPLITVPNGLINQWKDEFYTLYPGANVLVADNTDFEKDNRRALFARIASGDWDAVILGHSSFQFIGVNPEEERHLINEQVKGIEDALKAASDSGDKRSASVKGLERAKKSIEKKVKEGSDSGRKDDLLTFEQLGVDALFVDEADTFKNLAIVTSHSNIAGLGSTTPTQKCTDLFLKVRSLQKRNDGKGVYFLTATPISNSIAELYTMQRYLQFDTLKEKNLLAFDAWASTFGQITADWELDATGMNYRVNKRFGKFNNVPELMRMYRTFADVVTQKDLAKQALEDGTGRLVPKVAGGKPQNVICERSPLQEFYMGVDEPFKDDDGNLVLDANGQRISAWNSGSIIDRMVNRRAHDNALNVTMDARLAALDFRIIAPEAPDWEKSKINAAAERIYSLWEKNDYRRGTQLVFCDLSTPKGRSGTTALKEDGEEGDNDDLSMNDILMRRRQPSSFSAYDELFRKLVDKGMPAEQIRFIQDAKNSAQLQELYRQVNNGDVRVLIGSTQKMGAGVNVQRRLVGQHHLDCPWRPRDIEQRDGRIIRQGNLFFEEDRQNFEVEIYRYATEKTYDARMWQTIEVKARAIEQFRNGSLEDRTIQDVASEAASAAEMKAAATGNPLMFMQVQINANKRKEETRYRSWQRVQHAQQSRRADLPGRIERLKEQISQNELNIAYLAEHKEDADLITRATRFQTSVPEGEKTRSKDDLANLHNYISFIAQRACDRAAQGFDHSEEHIGRYKGVDISVKGHIPKLSSEIKAYPEFVFSVDDQHLRVIKEHYAVPLSIKYSHSDSFNVKGLLTRIDNALNSYPKKTDDFNVLLNSQEKEFESLSLNDKAEYPDMFKLDQLRRDSMMVMAELRKTQEQPDYISEWSPSVTVSEEDDLESAAPTIFIVNGTENSGHENDEVIMNKRNRHENNKDKVKFEGDVKSVIIDGKVIDENNAMDFMRDELKKFQEALIDAEDFQSEKVSSVEITSDDFVKEIEPEINKDKVKFEGDIKSVIIDGKVIDENNAMDFMRDELKKFQENLIDAEDFQSEKVRYIDIPSDDLVKKIESEIIDVELNNDRFSLPDDGNVQNESIIDNLERKALVERQSQLSDASIAEPEVDPVLANKITWLNVPYMERKEAAAAAGKNESGVSLVGFDKELKLWFAKEGADLSKLQKWLPENVVPENAVDAAQELADLLRMNGFLLEGLPLLDGDKHRVRTEGDKDGQTSGVYCAFSDGRPAGWFMNFKLHETNQKWVSGNVTLSAEESAHLRATAAQTRQDRAQATAQTYDHQAQWVTNFVNRQKDADDHHKYLLRKGVPAVAGLKVDPDGTLVVPLSNVDGDIRSMESIKPDGSKTLKKDAEMSGNFFIVGDEGKGLSATQDIFYAEGYASAASIHMATGQPVVMCVAAVNIPLVAKNLKEKFPDANHHFFADDDHAAKVNIGVKKAMEARDLTDGNIYIPTLLDEERKKGLTDFNDIHVSNGLDNLKEMIGYQMESHGVTWGLTAALPEDNQPAYLIVENDKAQLEYDAAASLFEQYLLGENNAEAVHFAAGKAADSGSAAAMFLLAACYTDGIGTVPDSQMANTLLEIAEQNGSADASYRLGEILEHGQQGKTRDLQAAGHHYRLAAEHPELKKLATAALSRVEREQSAPVDMDGLKQQRNVLEKQINAANQQLQQLTRHESEAASRLFTLGNGTSIACFGDKSHDLDLQKHIRICMNAASTDRVALSRAAESKDVGSYRGINLVVKSEEGKFTFGLVTPQGKIHEPESMVFEKGVRETFNLGVIIGAIDTYLDDNKIIANEKIALKQGVESLTAQISNIDSVISQNPATPAPKPRTSNSPGV